MLSLFPPNPDIVKPKNTEAWSVCLMGMGNIIQFILLNMPGFQGNRVWIMMRFNTVHQKTNANLNSNAKL